MIKLYFLLPAAHLSQWKSENRPAVLLHVPVFLGELISVASEQGFTLHHVKGEEIVMSKWLQDRPNKLPKYASHQVGVCGESRVTQSHLSGVAPVICMWLKFIAVRWFSLSIVHKYQEHLCNFKLLLFKIAAH